MIRKGDKIYHFHDWYVRELTVFDILYETGMLPAQRELKDGSVQECLVVKALVCKNEHNDIKVLDPLCENIVLKRDYDKEFVMYLRVSVLEKVERDGMDSYYKHMQKWVSPEKYARIKEKQTQRMTGQKKEQK